ncbi:uncharacterized protein N7484_006237 [Penicillium longicatenatum]|uniref:uncharacterized protein n=1 Tax=Penicillium longicatenatum TaxID=1561947 RepID=UPI0025487400|nr:uncharacterized protein N7484_006237 [Penicillium longicatenatum]KAJ5643730.1 hypothetical protein N7484_006237 [Penicillium longicatenatum]
MPGTVAEGPTVSMSFANNFWGKDDAGLQPMLDRMHGSKTTSDELKAFYNVRAAIEDEYARKLQALCRKPFGTCESGSLRVSLDVVRGETEAIAKAHAAIAAQMKTELEEPLGAFASGLKERRKIIQNGIERLHKTKMQQTHVVNKARDRFEQNCLQIKGYLAQGHMVMGQEERKNKSKLEKTQIQMASNSQEYEAAVKVLEDTTGRWNKEWKAACDKFQDLEEERLDFTKSSLWTYANIASTVCVSDDASCEKIRLSLENCEVEKDIFCFIQERGTGQEIPDPPRFINFCKEDDDAGSDIDSGEGYSVAQFQRTMNPAFRTSSPQPSTYESHHDPESDLAAQMGHPAPPAAGVPQPSPQSMMQEPPVQRMPQQAPPQSIQPEPPLQRMPAPQSIQQEPPVQRMPQQAPPQKMQQEPPLQRMPQQAPPQNVQQERPLQRIPQQQPPAQSMQPESPLQRLPPQQSAMYAMPQQPAPLDLRRGGQPPPNYNPEQHGAINAVPHNAYPTDGMTMFCRTGPPSERSSAASPYRPSSRDSQSDVSNPTSMSSVEAAPAQAAQKAAPPLPSVMKLQSSPKPTSNTPSASAQDDKSPKKKSAFFSNSPFRRKSRHDKERPTIAAASTSRSPWSSPTKQSTPAKTAPSPVAQSERPSNSPEPVDPRANFQLNVGNNVFDVASPDKNASKPGSQAVNATEDDSDPIARALADLKTTGGKQPSLRVSADRYHGISTPTPSAPSSTYGGGGSAAPPAYNDPNVKRLGAPEPAFTAKQMQKTTQRYTGQTASMLRGGSNNPAMTPRETAKPQDVPRARSPAPSRSPAPRRSASPQVSPRVDPRTGYGGGGVSPSPSTYQSGSARSRYSASPTPRRAQEPPYSPNDYARRAASPAASSHRAVSPQPQFRQQVRPSSAGGMELQLSAGQDDMYGGGSQYGGSTRGDGRSRSYYGGNNGGPPVGRSRSRTVAVADPGRKFSRDGRPILHFARSMYTYTPAIPEELGFSKGDVLSVIRLQDDGWWEAEVTNGRGHPGLVPSNYLQII